MDNVQDYTLTSRKPTEPFHALIVLSSVHEIAEGNPDHRCVIDKAHPLNKEDILAIRQLLRSLAIVAMATTGSSHNTPAWDTTKSPYNAKKARCLR